MWAAGAKKSSGVTVIESNRSYVGVICKARLKSAIVN